MNKENRPSPVDLIACSAFLQVEAKWMCREVESGATTRDMETVEMLERMSAWLLSEAMGGGSR